MLVIADLAYGTAPPIILPSGLAFKAPKSPTTIIYETNGWVVVKGSGASVNDTIQLDKTSAKPTNQPIVIEMAKAFKGSRKDVTDGGFSQVIYGKFTDGAEGDYWQLTLSNPPAQGRKSFAISLKGITVGTVIAKRCAPIADDIKYAVLTEVKFGKGVTLTAGGKPPYGVIGGLSVGNIGTIGISPYLMLFTPLVAQIPVSETELGKATGKGMISDCFICSPAIPMVNGKPKAKLNTPILNNVHALSGDAGAYKVRNGQTIIYDLWWSWTEGN